MRLYDDLYDGVVERPEADSPQWRVACYPIVSRAGLVLMVQPVWAERWELPGGGVEAEREELLIEAAVRECHEETGFRVNVDATSLAFDGEAFFSIARSGAYFHSLYFTVMGGVASEPAPDWKPIPDEIRRVGWIDLHTTQDAIHPVHRRALVARGLMPPIRAIAR